MCPHKGWDPRQEGPVSYPLVNHILQYKEAPGETPGSQLLLVTSAGNQHASPIHSFAQL